MKQSIALEFSFFELQNIAVYAEAQAKDFIKSGVGGKTDKEVLENCEKLKKLLLANSSMEFIIMDNPF